MSSNREAIMALLEAKPLGEAIKEILDSGDSNLRTQIAVLEKQLDGHIANGVRPLLQEALEKLKEAEHQDMLPLHLEIAKAISKVAKKNGLAIKKSTNKIITGNKPKKRMRYTIDEVKSKVLASLPAESGRGISGSLLAKECGISYQTLIKHLNNLDSQGIICREGSGAKTTWHKKV